MKDFKKIISVFILLSLIFSSCSFWWWDKSEEEKKEESIVFSNPTNEKNTDFFLNPDSDLELALGWPYYISNKNLDQPFFNEFNKLKQKKVEEAVWITEDIFKDSVKLREELSDFKKSYIALFSEILPENSDLAKTAKASAEIILDYQLKEDILITNYNEIKLDSENDAINSYFKYTKTYLAIKLSDTVYEDLNTFISISAQAVLALEDRDEIKNQLKDFDKKMETIINLQDTLANIQKNQIILNTALKQIETANYYMSKGSIAFIKQNLPDLKQKVESLKQRKDIDKEDVDFLESYVSYYADLTNSLDTAIENNFDKDRILEVNVTKEDISYIEKLLPITYAETEESKWFFSKALWAIKYTAKWAFNLTKKTAKFSWKTAKATYKWTKAVVWFTAWLVDTTAKSSFDTAFWVYNGNSFKEIKDNIYNNFSKFKDNVKKWTAWSNLFKNAWEMLDWAEDVIASVPEWAVEKTIWKWRISWGTAGLTKMTVWMFTWLGKWIYKIANAKSSNWEIAEWYLDVGLSFIGWSKVLFKSSKLFSATSKIKWFKEMLKWWLVFIEKSAVKLKWQSIKWLSKAAIKKLWLIPWKIKILVMSNPKEKVKQLLKNKLTNLSDGVRQKLQELSKRWLKDIIKSSAWWLDEIKWSYEWFVKSAYEKWLKGYLESIVWVVWWSADDYLDNLVWWEIDNLIKSAIKEAIDSWIIPWLEWPFDWKYKASIEEEDFNEYINNFDVIVVWNILSANVQFSKIEDEGSISGNIDFNWDIDESWSLQNWKMEWTINLTIKWKQYGLGIKADLNWTFTENWGTIISSNWKIVDKDGVIWEIVKAIAKWVWEALWWESEWEWEAVTTWTTKGKELDIDSFNMILTKDWADNSIKTEENITDTWTGGVE